MFQKCHALLSAFYQLSSVAARFWWGDAEGKKKVHWIGWDRMCQGKQRGGMGFTNHQDFNQAFLAKQAWRLVSSPNSLCARVLWSRYFKNDEFMAAKCPKHASFTWRSIIHGRDLLMEGLVWRIRDGVRVRVMTDWIPKSSLQRPYELRPEKEVTMVSELLQDNDGGWKVDKFMSCFTRGMWLTY
jgi:hypothetical protein